MAVSSTYYLNGPSLGSATAVFTNAALTVCAANGFYSDGVIVREQAGCILLPQQTCACLYSQFIIYFDVSTTPPIPLGWASPVAACAGTGTPLTVYINGLALDLHDVVSQGLALYTNASYTIPLNGSNTWYKTVSAPSSGESFQVDASGFISAFGTPC